MPNISINVDHSLGQEEALSRLKQKLAEMENTHGDQIKDLQQQWTDNTLSASCKAMSMAISGTLCVEEKQIKIDAKVPLTAMIFKGAIEQRVQKEMTDLLS
jgi:hypothetical protein